MKLSIIIPCFNEEKYIEEVIDSINSQKIEDKEIIVVNDASTDGTKEKLTKLTASILKTLSGEDLE